jgi:hypothetical protein
MQVKLYFFFPFVNPASSKSSREAFFTSFFFLTMGALVLLCCCSSFDSFSLLAATLASNLSLSSAFRSAGRPSYEGNFSVSIVAIIASKLRLRVRLALTRWLPPDCFASLACFFARSRSL